MATNRSTKTSRDSRIFTKAEIKAATRRDRRAAKASSRDY